jgi:hypothetical protein
MTKDEMLEKYQVLGFAMGMCIVKDKETGVKGTLYFDDDPTFSVPRNYHTFVEVI